MNHSQPKLAILFWHYKEPEICVNRLQGLRRLNPDIPIFGLFGGNPDQFSFYETLLGKLLDDHWCFKSDHDSEWKWRHGDLVLNAWHRDKGCQLTWDTLIIMQWDMLAIAPVSQIFSPLNKDEIYLPGLRPIDELEHHWWWTKPNTPQGDEYARFKLLLRDQHSFSGPYQACQFITAALPRSFMDKYAQIKIPELGFLEYKLSAYAHLFDTPFRQLPQLQVTWPENWNKTPRVTLTAAKREIRDIDIVCERLTPGGARLFHPVSRTFPVIFSGKMLKLIAQTLFRTTTNR
jgi:hypothetical protein